MEISIRPLAPSLVHQANMNSMGGKRGDLSVTSYESYCERVLSWPISDEKKQKIIDQIYQKLSEQLRHEARHVSVMVQAAEEGAGRLGQEVRPVFRRSYKEAGGGLCQGEDRRRYEDHLWGQPGLHTV